MYKSGYLVYALLLLVVAAPTQAQQNQFGGAVAVGVDEVFVSETQNVISAGTVYVYRRDASDGMWTEAAQLQASDAVPDWDDRFGRVLVADGNRLLVGATRKDNTRGGAYVFEKDASGSWTEVARLTAQDAAEADHLGRVLALSGDFAFVSALGFNESRGAVYVFQRDSQRGTWSQHAKLAVDTLQSGDYFGMAVAVDGDKALISAPFRGRGAGVVYAFRYDKTANAWVSTGILGEGVAEQNFFGMTLALHGDLAFVGVPSYEGNLGAVDTYRYDEGSRTWHVEDRLAPSDGDQGRLASSLAVNGNEIWAGAPGAGGFQGAVYTYRLDGDSWGETAKLTLPEPERGDFFAGALAVNGDLAVVGVTGDDNGAGTAAIFEREAAGWVFQNIVFNEVSGMASITGDQVDCADGEAAAFGCQQVDLMSFLSVKDIGGGRGVNTNDVWGWTDPETGKEYALVGRVDGTSFVDISNPYNPVFIGDLPKTANAPTSGWRDIKVYKNHAFIVADGAGEHGMQVFDLTQLRNVAGPPMTFHEVAHYDGIHSAHNIVINEESGFAYAVGSNGGGETCGGGLHIIDIRDPLNPAFAGCFSDTATGRSSTGYSHDAQCVIYHGPDTEHQGKEVCFGSNETALSIADVTDKDSTIALANASYPNVGYSHQGWLTDDHRYFYMDDELDELQGKVDGTRTLIWDVTDLDDPQLLKEHLSENKSSDHNLYIKGNLMYQSNYLSGLRIYDISDVANPVEVAYFDTVPYGEDAPGFNGSWSNFPYFKSGVIVVTSMQEGVFLLKKREIDI